MRTPLRVVGSGTTYAQTRGIPLLCGHAAFGRSGQIRASRRQPGPCSFPALPQTTTSQHLPASMDAFSHFDIPAITIDRPIPEPGKPGVKWWTQSARRWLNRKDALEQAEDLECAQELSWGIGKLNVASPLEECPSNGSPLDLHDLATSLTVSLHHKPDLTELVSDWLDEALMSSSDDTSSDEDAQLPATFEYDTDGDESEPQPDFDHSLRGTTSAPEPQPLCVCPQDILPQPVIAGSAEDVMSTVWPAHIPPAGHFTGVRSWAIMELDSSDDERDSHIMPPRKRQRLSDPGPQRRPQSRKKQRKQRKRRSVYQDDLSSDGESYFSEDIHLPRPMSPLTGLANQMESCLLSPA